jgi:hypothetical protein
MRRYGVGIARLHSRVIKRDRREDKMKLCHTVTDADYPVKLEQSTNGKFRVTYGLQIKSNLTYGDAAKEYGACIMHSVACLGLLDNDVP